MILENEIPLARGMGSSAAAIIAGITCYELLFDDRLSKQDLFRFAFEFENHPDNLAAALYGGLIAAGVADDGSALTSKLTVATGVRGIVVIPAFELSTEKARAVLPGEYSRKDAVYNIQRSALTIAALTTGDWQILRESMRDRIHQPYRSRLIPGLDAILGMEAPGLYGVALSGAGPTVFAFADAAHVDELGATIASIFARHGVRATPHPVNIDQTGRLIESS
jgi:homoserine kinase